MFCSQSTLIQNDFFLLFLSWVLHDRNDVDHKSAVLLSPTQAPKNSKNETEKEDKQKECIKKEKKKKKKPLHTNVVDELPT